jgi:sugar O-acyltransferase (sialic acid O-acetyltransferase NeuD family)
VIFGAGGHGRVVADAALAQGRWGRVRVTDRDAGRVGQVLWAGLVVEAAEEAIAGSGEVHVAIGSAVAREREARALSVGFDASLSHRHPTGNTMLPLATVIHPDATVSQHAEIGAGCFLAAQSVVAPGARLGVSVIVNHGAVVDHDAQVGDFTHVAPLAALGGGVQVCRRVLVGAGARLLPGVRVADDVVIGAGAVVRDSIEHAGVYAGVPARRVR